MRFCCTFVLILSIATSAFAQDRLSGSQAVRPSGKLIISSSAIDAGMAAHPPVMQSSSRDSLMNGTLIGGAIGAVAMGAFAGWLCHMLQEPGEPTCWRSVPIGGLYGAGIGAAAGAGIDALFVRQPQLQRPRAKGSPQQLRR
jgi:hypothetical protein